MAIENVVDKFYNLYSTKDALLILGQTETEIELQPLSKTQINFASIHSHFH